MQKKIIFFSGLFLIMTNYASDQVENSVTSKPLNIEFNRENAQIFLEGAKDVILHHHSMIRSFLIRNDGNESMFYQMQPAGFDFLQQDEQFHLMQKDMEMMIDTYLDTLKNSDESSPEFKNAIQAVFEALTFLISHVRWNICEIQYDMYRSTVGYYQKPHETVLNTYAINRSDTEQISYSAYHKGKFALLHADNPELAPLVKYVQYEELSRSHQLYTTFQAYVMHYYQIFGENEDTTYFLQNLIQSVENQFQEHSKRFTLDHILRFSGNAGIGRLLY